MEDKEENLSDNFISRWSKRKARNNIKDNSEVKKDQKKLKKKKALMFFLKKAFLIDFVKLLLEESGN